MEEQKRTISEFNENAFKISRLHNDWLMIKKFRESSNFPKLKRKLDSIEGELFFDAKKIDNEIKSNYIKQLNDINDKIKGLKDNIQKEGMKSLERAYDLYLDKEKLLREIQQKSGLGSTYKDIDEDEM